MTSAQLRLLLLTSELELVNAAIAKLDRHGFSATRPELCGNDVVAALRKREALVRDVYEVRGQVLTEQVRG